MTKVNSLEEKIKEYCKSERGIIMDCTNRKEFYHDIAEICEKDYEDKIDCDKCNDLQDENIRLKDEVNKLDEGIHHHKDPHWKMFQDIQIHLEAKNKTLQDKLDSIKMLDRWKVLDLYLDYIEDEFYRNCKEEFESGVISKENLRQAENIRDDFITAICNLAIQPITKDRIIEVLKKHEYYTLIDHINNSDMEGVIPIEQIAIEILNDKTIDCYDKEGNIVNKPMEKKE